MAQAVEGIKQILLDRLAYLNLELQALQTLTDVLPFDQDPPEGISIFGHLNSIYLAENKWIRPLIDKISPDSSTLSLSIESIPSLEGVKELSTIGNSHKIEETHLLVLMVDSRSVLLNLIDSLSNEDFNRKIWVQSIEEQLTVSDVINLFLDVETQILKLIGRFVSDVQTENIMLRSVGIRG